MKRLILMLVVAGAAIGCAQGQQMPAVGDRYTDIAVKNAEGEVLSLSTYVEANKYVLLDFWASWCGPCMGEIPYLRAAYEKYHGLGFEIFGVSLDHKKDAWLTAVQANNMTWIQVAERMSGTRQSKSASDIYGVEYIPSNFLIRNDGVIVAVGLRESALAEKLAELLGK